MKCSELFSFLNQEFALTAIQVKSDGDLSDVLLLDGGLSEFREDTLYIGHVSQLENNGPVPLNFLYWGQPMGSLPFEKTNSAWIVQENFAAVFNCVKQIFMDALRVKGEYGDMMKMILEGKSLSAILDFATQRVGNAFAVLDISGKLLAHSSPFNVPDPLWIRSVSDGYCSYDFMNHIKQMRFKGNSPKTSEAFISVCEETQITYLCSKILLGGSLMGYVFMFQDEAPIDVKSREILPSISRVAGELISRTQESSDLRSNLYHNVMSDMLAGIDLEHANVRIQVSELSFPAQMCIVKIHPLYYRGAHYVSGYLQQLLLNYFTSPPPLCYQGGIVLVLPVNDARHLEQDLVAKLTGLAEKEHLLIGISNGFTQASQLAVYYSQAEEALRFSSRMNIDGNLFYYHDYAFYGLISALPGGINPRKYDHPALSLLRSYDLENKTELYQTLKTFTETGLNQRRTAEKLFLHRNTLNYRMHRIQELTGIDLKDPDLLFQLMYSFKLDEFSSNEF